jgi:hypothetical protein
MLLIKGILGTVCYLKKLDVPKSAEEVIRYLAIGLATVINDSLNMKLTDHK